WPPSYAVVSSSTSANTTPGVSRFSSAHCVVTRTSSRLIERHSLSSSRVRWPVAFVVGADARAWTAAKSSGGAPRTRRHTLDQQVHLTAEAEVERRVEERGEQREGRGDGTERGHATGIPDGAHQRERETH